MKKTRARNSSLFLLELIIAILFFSIASAICLQLFVRSHLLSEKAEQLNIAVNQASSAAEILRSSDSPADYQRLLSEVYPEDSSTADTFTVYYDAAFEICSQPEAQFSMQISSSLEDGFLKASIVVAPCQETSESLYELNAEKYVGGAYE